MLKKLVVVVFTLTLFVFVSPVLAENDDRPSSMGNSIFTRQDDDVRPSPRPSPLKERALNEIRFRACQAHESAIQNRAQSLVRLVEGMEKTFTSIAARVEAFYQSKVDAGGKALDNYDGLVADISAKKEVVDKDLADVQDNVNTFGCDSDQDPKQVLNQYRVGMQKVKTDLRSYRTAIKNLIVAVRGTVPTETPEASETQ